MNFSFFLQQDKYGNLVVITNLLYMKDRLFRVFTRLPTTATRNGSKVAIHSNNRISAKMQQDSITNEHYNLFPDKTKDLGGATLNVSKIKYEHAYTYAHAYQNLSLNKQNKMIFCYDIIICKIKKKQLKKILLL